MRWLRRRRPPQPLTIPPEPTIPTHSWEWDLRAKPETWNCSCGAAGAATGEEMAWPALRQHMYDAAAPLIPQLSNRQLAAALRAEVLGRNDDASELLIAHGTWLSDPRFRRMLKGLWKADGELTVLVDWNSMAHALGVITEMLHMVRGLRPPMRMWPYIDEWTFLPKPEPAIVADDDDRTDVAVLRTALSLATHTPIGIDSLGARVHPHTRAMIIAAITRSVARQRLPTTAEFHQRPPPRSRRTSQHDSHQ